MGLGVYEDTGSFTFPSTTERDLEAAAWLLSQGANLNIITNLLTREITPEQVSLLNDLFQRAIRHCIHGIDVVVTSVSTRHYMPDFAFLVHKMMRMENIDAIFAIARMDNKIHIVVFKKGFSILGIVKGMNREAFARESLRKESADVLIVFHKKDVLFIFVNVTFLAYSIGRMSLANGLEIFWNDVFTVTEA